MPADTDLVSLERCKVGLNITEPDWDMQLDTLITAASEIVTRYIDAENAAEFEVTGGVDQTLVPKRVQQATIALVSAMMDPRVDNPQMVFSADRLPPLVTALLRPLRTPNLA